MADVRPLQALHYNLSAVPSLADVTAPPYDVIDAEARARAARPLAVQRRRDRPAGGPEGRGPLRARGRDARGMDAPGHPHRGSRRGALAPRAGVQRTRRGAPHPARVPLPGRRHRLRAGPGPPPRAHPAGAQGGSPPPHASDAPQPLPDLLAPRGQRLAGPRAGARRRSMGRGDRPRRDRPPRLARRRPGRPRRGQRRARGLGAPDRRRPPPLRDRTDLCRGDRRRGRAPLHADGARLARGPRPDRLRIPPAAHRPSRLGQARDPRERAPRALRDRGGPTRSARPGRRGAESASSATSTPTSSEVSACASRTRPRSTPRSPTAPSRTAASTPRSSRPWSCVARSA